MMTKLIWKTCLSQIFHLSLPNLRTCLAANLEENEKIKAELAPTKINEPKTPFHAPYSEDEDVDIALDPEEGGHALDLIQHGHSLNLQSQMSACHAEAEADMTPLSLEDRGQRTSIGSLKGCAPALTRPPAVTVTCLKYPRLSLERVYERSYLRMSTRYCCAGRQSGKPLS